MTRLIYQIADEIHEEINAGRWSKHAAFYAAPYLGAMKALRHPSDFYGADSAKSIIRYFLSNAGTWRGETARRIKAELKEMVK